MAYLLPQVPGLLPKWLLFVRPPLFVFALSRKIADFLTVSSSTSTDLPHVHWQHHTNTPDPQRYISDLQWARLPPSSLLVISSNHPVPLQLLEI